MGACLSSSASTGGATEPSRADKERSFAIDKQLDDDAKRFRRECKILLLGTLPAPRPRALLTVPQALASRASRPL